MKKVASFEKKRTGNWILWAGVIFAGLVFIFATFSAAVWESLNESQALSLLTLFQEDGEVIDQFWQDTLATFWEELPLREAVILVISLIAIVIVSVVIIKKLPVIKRRLKGLAKYSKSIKN